MMEILILIAVVLIGWSAIRMGALIIMDMIECVIAVIDFLRSLGK